MSAEQQTNRPKGRRQFLINPKFQLRVIAYMVCAALLTIVVFYGANWKFFNDFAEMGRTLGLSPDHVYFQFLDEQKTRLTKLFAATAVVVFFGLSITGLLMSHKVAGPLYRLRRHMSNVGDGNTEADVSFRSGDYFPELADSFNSVMKRVRGGSSSGGGGNGQGDDKAA